jgi:hypothetical protein
MPVGEDLARPVDQALSFVGQALVPVGPAHYPDVELGFQFADPGRQRGLGDVTLLRRPAEVPFLRERHQVFELAEQHHTVGYWVYEPKLP